MTKCLVVGGSGYVGGELCQQLYNQGFDLYVFDYLDRSEQIPGKWLKGDITQADTISIGTREFDF